MTKQTLIMKPPTYKNNYNRGNASERSIKEHSGIVVGRGEGWWRAGSWWTGGRVRGCEDEA